MKAHLIRIKEDIETLATFTSTPSLGVTRLPFTPEDRKAQEYLKKKMIEAGLKVREDGVGTIIGKSNAIDPNAPTIMLGSHIDSVKQGGAFDGAAGVVAALEVARVLKDNGVITKHPIEVVVMNDEEGVRFKFGMLSSRAIVGNLTEEELDTFVDEDGISIRKAMNDFGIAPDIKKAKRVKDSIRAYLELHIEQGPVLESNNIDIGIVKNIVGLAVYKVTIEGRAGHAGTTPMNLRKDALIAASNSIIKLNTIVKNMGKDTVVTVGELDLLPGAANVIPRLVEFTVDLRSSSDEKIKQALMRFKEILIEIENDMGVKASINEKFYIPPIGLSEAIIDQIDEGVTQLGYTSMHMNSGAGHDAMVMADYVPTGMVFVPSKNGISHNPEEWTNYENIQKGVEVLLETVLALDQDV